MTGVGWGVGVLAWIVRSAVVTCRDGEALSYGVKIAVNQLCYNLIFGVGGNSCRDPCLFIIAYPHPSHKVLRLSSGQSFLQHC